MSTVASPAPPVRSKVSGLSVGVLLFRLRALIALFVLIAVFSVLTPSFFTGENLIILVGQTAINAIMAVGMTFVILTGGIDLSVGSIVGFSAMMSGLLINRGVEIPPLGVVLYFNIPMVIVLCLCLGVIVGVFNGILITRFNVAPFIATLGTLYVARGAAQLSNDGATFPNLVGRPELGNTGFPILGAGSILGIPIVIWIMVIFASVAAFIAGKTPFGRQVYAVGGNERAAELLRDLREPHQNGRVHDLWSLRGDDGIDHRVSAGGGTSGDWRKLRTERDRGRGSWRYFFSWRTRYDVGNDCGSASDWCAHERPRSARGSRVLEKGNYRICDHSSGRARSASGAVSAATGAQACMRSQKWEGARPRAPRKCVLTEGSIFASSLRTSSALRTTDREDAIPP